jgi:pimeloyl-ACP methyl ester carboxylesterase
MDHASKMVGKLDVAGGTMRRRYIDGVFGQVHLLETQPLQDGGPPLLCLHATAYSSQSFRPLLTACGGKRHCIALDTPGYGASDPPAAPIDMGGYADAFIDAAARLANGAVDVIGYHTGAYIAAEACLRRPDMFRRLIMIGVPYFHGADRAYWEALLTAPHSLGDSLAQFGERWDTLVAHRARSLSLARGFENFVDEIRAYPRGWWAHRALFDYDDRSRLRGLRLPVLIVNYPGHLAEGSRAAAALIPQANIIEAPHLEPPVLETAPGFLMDCIETFLDRA